jgi:hypothetical protein
VAPAGVERSLSVRAEARAAGQAEWGLGRVPYGHWPFESDALTAYRLQRDMNATWRRKPKMNQWHFWDFDSAIPRFESWRPAKNYLIKSGT